MRTMCTIGDLAYLIKNDFQTTYIAFLELALIWQILKALALIFQNYTLFKMNFTNNVNSKKCTLQCTSSNFTILHQGFAIEFQFH